MCPQATASSSRTVRAEAMRYLGQVKRVCPKAVIGA
jgi:hypothetical protein